MSRVSAHNANARAANEDNVSVTDERRTRLQLALQNWLKQVEERKAEFQRSVQQIDRAIAEIDSEYTQTLAQLQEALRVQERGQTRDKLLDADFNEQQQRDTLMQGLKPAWIGQLEQYPSSDTLSPAEVLTLINQLGDDAQQLLRQETVVELPDIAPTLNKIQLLHSEWLQSIAQERGIGEQREQLRAELLRLQGLDQLSRLERMQNQVSIVQLGRQYAELYWPWRRAQLKQRYYQEQIYNLLQDERSRWIVSLVNQRHTWQQDVNLDEYAASLINQLRYQDQLKEQLQALERERVDLVRESGEAAFSEYEQWEHLLDTDRALFEQAWRDFEIRLEAERKPLMDLDVEDWPAPMSDHFAYELLRVLPPEQYAMPVPDLSSGSRCPSDIRPETTEEDEEKASALDIEASIERLGSPRSAVPPPAISSTSYQRVVGRWNHPALTHKYKTGLMIDYSVGAGKTRAALEAILTWYRHSGESTRTDRQVLVLLPTTRLFGSWADDLRKMTDLFQYFLPPAVTFSDSVNTVEWRFQNEFSVVLQNMTAALPERIYRRWTKESASDARDTISVASRLMVDQQSYTTNPIYASLPTATRERLNQELRRTAQLLRKNQQRFKNDRRVALPSRGLLFVDEAQDLANPGSKLKRAEQSNTVLAWAMTIRYAENIRKNLMTGTPLYDETRLMDFFRLINLLKHPSDTTTRPPEGIWRRILSLSAQREEQRAGGGAGKGAGKAGSSSVIEQAENAEQEFIRTLYFNENEQWRSPQVRLQFQRLCTGLWSWVSLEHDVTIYPRLDTGCDVTLGGGAGGGCLLMYRKDDQDPQGFRLVPAPEMRYVAQVEAEQKQVDEVPDAVHAGTTKIFVPLEPTVYKNYQEKLREDLAQYNMFRIATTECETAAPNAACLRYTDARLKTGVSRGWGFKSTSTKGEVTHSGKFQVLQRFVEQFSTDKHWVFSAARLYNDFGKYFIEYFRQQQWELVGMVQILNFMTSLLPNPRTTSEEEIDRAREGTRYAEEWYRQAVPGQRYLFFGASTTAVELEQVRTRAERDYGIDETLLLQVVSSIYNHAQNRRGEYIRMFVGDVTAMTGLSLRDTRWAYLLEPALTNAARTQSIARILRYCSLAREPNIENWLVHVIEFVSSAPVLAQGVGPAKRAGKGAAKRGSGKRAGKASGKRAGKRGKAAVAQPQEEDQEGQGTAAPVEQKEQSVAGLLLTNEQYHLQQQVSQGSAIADQLLEAVRETAIDCFLMRDYNSRPDRRVQCFTGEVRENDLGPPRRLRRFQVCYTRTPEPVLVIDQPGTAPTFIVRAREPIVRAPDRDRGTFEQLCQSEVGAENTGVRTEVLRPYTYVDELMLELLEDESDLTAPIDIVDDGRPVESLYWLLTAPFRGENDTTRTRLTYVDRILQAVRTLDPAHREVLGEVLENKQRAVRSTSRIQENREFALRLWRLYQQEWKVDLAAHRALQQFERLPRDEEFQNLGGRRRTVTAAV